MSTLCKYEDQEKELGYFRALVNIAVKSGNHSDKTPETMLNIMLTAKDFGISPMKALHGGFYVVKGKLGMSTALMADRIRRDGHSIKIPEWTSEKCTIIGVRKDNGDSVKVEFTKEDAERAGLLDSPMYKKWPKNMYYNRAMATLGRVLFPDILGSAYSEDERYDLLDVPPAKRPAEDCDSFIIEPVLPSVDTDHVQILIENVQLQGVPSEYVKEYIEILADRSGKSSSSLAESALLSERFPKFMEYYEKHLEKKEVVQASIAE